MTITVKYCSQLVNVQIGKAKVSAEQNCLHKCYIHYVHWIFIWKFIKFSPPFHQNHKTGKSLNLRLGRIKKILKKDSDKSLLYYIVANKIIWMYPWSCQESRSNKRGLSLSNCNPNKNPLYAAFGGGKIKLLML